MNTNLATTEGYTNIYNGIVEAFNLGTDGNSCEETLQLPGDANQDNTLNIADAVSILGHLFVGSPEFLPCEGGDVSDQGNITLLDLNEDEKINIADVIYILSFLFSDGPPPALGTECVPIFGCPDSCLSR